MEDATQVLEAIVGYDPEDPATAACQGKTPPSYQNCLKPAGLAGKRLGVLRSFFGREDVNRPVNEVMAAALHLAAEAGAEFVLINEPIDPAALVRDISVHLHDLKTHLGEYLAAFGDAVPVHSLDEILASGKYTPDIEENLRQANALGTNAPDYAGRLERRGALQKRLTALLKENRLDVLVYPHQQLVCKAGQSQMQRNEALGSVTGYLAMAAAAP